MRSLGAVCNSFTGCSTAAMLTARPCWEGAAEAAVMTGRWVTEADRSARFLICSDQSKPSPGTIPDSQPQFNGQGGNEEAIGSRTDLAL